MQAKYWLWHTVIKEEMSHTARVKLGLILFWNNWQSLSSLPRRCEDKHLSYIIHYLYTNLFPWTARLLWLWITLPQKNRKMILLQKQSTYQWHHQCNYAMRSGWPLIVFFSSLLSVVIDFHGSWSHRSFEVKNSIQCDVRNHWEGSVICVAWWQEYV